MALARARRSESGFNYWPGFVDALSTLVLSIVFLLSVFLVVQFFLSQEVTGKDKALEELTAKIAQLNDLLSVEKLGKLDLADQLTQLKAGLASAETERDRVKGLYEGLAGAGNDAAGRANELNKALDSEKSVSARALAMIEVLNQQISSRRWKKRSMRRRSATRNRRTASPISVPGSTWRWRSACRNCRAIARSSSGGCAPSSATGPTSASSATASYSSPKCFSTPARRRSCQRALPSSTRLPMR